MLGKKFMEDSRMEREIINIMRDKLNNMVVSDNISLCSGEILKLSQQLDNLICIYYSTKRLAS